MNCLFILVLIPLTVCESIDEKGNYRITWPSAAVPFLVHDDEHSDTAMNDSQIFTRSRRSSALSISSSNIRQPTWKGSLLGRTTTPLVGVSTVLAEPELDSALSSASGILSSNSSISQTTVPEGDGSSNKSSFCRHEKPLIIS